MVIRLFLHFLACMFVCLLVSKDILAVCLFMEAVLLLCYLVLVFAFALRVFVCFLPASLLGDLSVCLWPCVNVYVFFLCFSLWCKSTCSIYYW